MKKKTWINYTQIILMILWLVISFIPFFMKGDKGNIVSLQYVLWFPKPMERVQILQKIFRTFMTGQYNVNTLVMMPLILIIGYNMCWIWTNIRIKARKYCYFWITVFAALHLYDMFKNPLMLYVWKVDYLGGKIFYIINCLIAIALIVLSLYELYLHRRYLKWLKVDEAFHHDEILEKRDENMRLAALKEEKKLASLREDEEIAKRLSENN
ncbi:MAG: hypothetical protein J5984_00010 [Clostridia bacterium]|nr:hypothetical protein [Clostridia bacterium]